MGAHEVYSRREIRLGPEESEATEVQSRPTPPRIEQGILQNRFEKSGACLRYHQGWCRRLMAAV